ncbi:MAG: MFS transporter [Maritimibacter sp.]
MPGDSAKKRVWGWYWFDWASQPYHTLLLTFVYGPFFASVAAAYFISLGFTEAEAAPRAQAMWANSLTVIGLIIGIGAPIMGALADAAGRKRPWIVGFAFMYVLGAGALWFTDPGGSNAWPMMIAFGIGFIGAEYALIFINAQLPDLVEEADVGETSGSGFAFGYLGGVVSLLIALVFLVEQESGLTIAGLKPGFGLFDAEAREGTRFIGPFVALWFAVFMIPYWRWVREDGPQKAKVAFSDGMKLLGHSIRTLTKKKSLASFLLSSMFYRDALNGLYGFGGVYATLVLGWGLTTVGIFGIISAIAATFFCWIGGKIERGTGPKPVVIGSIWVLIGVVVTIVFMSREMIFGLPLAEGSTLPDIVFFSCGVIIGGMGGILQSSSRSLMVRHTDPKAPTEYFGLYGFSGRATAFMAPALIALVTTTSGSARIGVSPLIGLFILGLILLRWVKAEGVEYEK